MAAGIVYGQTSPQITVSTEKVKVNGEVMLVHKVKGGETLYSISRAYKVSIDEIVRRNEELKAGLKEGSTIYIPSTASLQAEPAKEAKPSPEATAVDAGADTGKAGNAAAVGKGQGKTLAERLKIGGLAGKKGKGGIVLPSGYDTKQYSKKKHTVKWYEKIEDVAAKYKVPVEAIVELNALETTLIKKKQVLYIPNDAFLKLMAQAGQEQDTPEENEKPDPQEQNDKTAEDTTAVDYPYNKEIDLLFILPLNLKDSIAPNSNFMDFYTGALVNNTMPANTGKMNITLVDQLMYKSIDDIIASGVLEDKDVIVGPVRPADVRKVLSETAGRSIVISPMDQSGESLAEGNPLFMQVPPAVQAQQENIIRLFADKYTAGKNAIVIHETGGADTTHLRIAKEILAARGVEYSTLSYGILEGREILGKMSGYMKPETENLVLVLSNSEAFVSDVVRNLNLICTNPVEENRRNITLFGLPRWRNFETIEVDYFHRMNLHLSLPYFVDYNNKYVKEFLMKYRALTNSEPTPFAFQGYDIAMIAREICGTFARPIKAFPTIPEFRTYFNLQLEHNYKRNGTGNGMLNTGTKNIMYNKDYTISVIE